MESNTKDRLTIHVERFPEVAVVRCKGELVAGVTDLLYRDVKELYPAVQRIVVDLKELTYMDSSGIGVIVRLFVSAKSAKCTLELANISGRVRQLLGLTHLLAALEVIGESNVRL